ncbi:MAG: DUF2345 domain-containing protein [Hydrogenophaga sp.]|uniref:contractile injection system protein, VgrG/Pvc8 family n=1 Tax=Hydrogenophaga sp. TaxID=1904254 RepID=UPI0025B855D8|nr:contractile injection system protein, VgrG/Pvc8 family [Hydrogenophaga sp.]MBU7576173.1 DUF2345 domain-containing protein [Hydrogenophaga sp.]
MTPFTPRRGLTIRSAALPEVNGAPLLEPLKLEGEEGINQLFEYRLVLQSAEDGAPLELDTFIGRELTCCLELEGQGSFVPGMPAGAGANQGAGVREISALITEARYIGESGRHALVEFTLRPWLHLATLSTDCKVFQDQSVVEIIEAVLGAYLLGLELNAGAESPADYRRALEVMHEGVKRGNEDCANYLFASFRGGDPLVGHAKDPSREDRYHAISERLRRDHHLKLPNLDRVLPLPPAPLPHWNSDPDTLIDAAKGVRVTPQPVTTSAHQLPPHHRAHIPPGHMLQVPAGRAHLARRPPMPGLGNILAEGPFTPGLVRAPVAGYWQARALPAHPRDEPYTAHLRREFSDLLPMHFQDPARAAHQGRRESFAAQGDIDIQALKKRLNLLAKLDISMAADRITLSAKEEWVINGGGSYTI